MNTLKMWRNHRPFEIDVQPGWELCLGRKVKIPVAHGHYNGMLGDGLEIRKDKNFICERPLYVLGDDPHQKLRQLCSAKQKIYERDECTGYVPNGLLPVKTGTSQIRGNHEDDTDNENDSGSENDGSRTVDSSYTYLGVDLGPVRKRKKFEASDSSEEEEDDDLIEYDDERLIQVPTADCKGIMIKDAVFLGAKIPPRMRLTLKEVMAGCLYSVHDEKTGDMQGYLIHMLRGITGPDLERFHSDEGWYEVSVLQNADENPVDFIAMLGGQNELNWYDLDRLDGRVDIEDLSWFDEHVERFTECAEWGPGRGCYPNKKYDGGSSSWCLSEGTYAIVPAKYDRKNWAENSLKGSRDCSCKRTSGVDSLGRKYQFPDQSFKLMKIEKNADVQRYKEYLIDVSKGGYASVDSIGNLTITFKKSEEKKRKCWEFDDSPVFRMYTDIRYAPYCPGDWSDYDADPDKTIPKYEAARRKAHAGFYRLPPKAPCCESCDKELIHRRCPKEVTV